MKLFKCQHHDHRADSETSYCTLHFSIHGVLAVGLAAVLFRGIFCGDSTPVLIGIKKKEGLEVTFDTFSDDIFPPGANL